MKKNEMKFSAYRVSSITERLEYIGTWYADTYASAMKMIMEETQLDMCSLRVFGRIA